MISLHEFHRLKQLQKLGLTVPQIAQQMKRDEKTVRLWHSRDQYERPVRGGNGSILDPYKAEIHTLLYEYERYTAQQLFQKVGRLGYEGGYTLVKEYVRKIRPPRREEAHGDYHPEPGQCGQVDFGHCGLIRVGKELKKVYVFVMVLSWSRMMYLKFILRENMEHFLTCHQKAFEFFGAVPQTLRPDCCKVAVLGHDAEGNPIYNPRYLDFALHHGCTLDACAPRKPYRKPSVENGIGYVKINFLNGLDLSQYTLEHLNREGRVWLQETANIRKHRTTNERPLARFRKEREAMVELPQNPYDCGIICTPYVDKQARFSYEGNKYSVPKLYHRLRINLHVHPDKLLAYYKGLLIAKHTRIYEKRSKPIILPEHEKSLKRHEAKERTRRLICRFTSLGSIAETYYHQLCKRHLNPVSHVRKIMALAEVHATEKVLRALEDSHVGGAYGSDYIHNLLAARSKLIQLTSPLHLARNQDLLDLEIDPPDLNQYDHYIKRNPNQ
ncbi:MAG: IS21 family transposase [Planctomycetes bacterium]|nr:IS21 family transposase [Planctomycetota bacterium]